MTSLYVESINCSILLIVPVNEILNFPLCRPFAKDNGTLPIQAIERVASGEMAEAAEDEGCSSSGGRGAEDITLLPLGCHPVLEYAVKPASVIVLVGPIKLERYYCNKKFRTTSSEPIVVCAWTVRHFNFAN